MTLGVLLRLVSQLFATEGRYLSPFIPEVLFYLGLLLIGKLLNRYDSNFAGNNINKDP